MASAAYSPDGSEVRLRDAKPAFEWILGRAIRKMSPRRRHAVLQAALGARLREWSGGRGIVGTEWHCRLAPWGEIRRPLVPDVSYVSRDRFAALTSEDDREAPPFAPDIVIEILSRGDKREYLEHKRDVYFATGAQLMLIVDPIHRTIEAFEASGLHHVFRGDATLNPSIFPGLVISLPNLFAELDPP
jgi:Uma2 family endonuclease